MAGIKFLSENLFDTATLSLTTGTANAQFPLNNLKNDAPSVKFRSTGNTAVVEIDLLQTRDIDTIAIAGDPTESIGVTAATVRTSVTTDFTGSSVDAIDISSVENIGFVSITEVSHRYVEITFTGNGSYVDLGKIFIGKAISITQNNISISSFAYNRRDKSRIRENRYGQKFIDNLPNVKSLGGSIEHTTLTEQEELDDMFLRHGTNLPLWMLIDETSSGLNEGKFKLTVYGYMNEYPRWSASGGQLYSTSLTVTQAV
jgi:hypothetical protein